MNNKLGIVLIVLTFIAYSWVTNPFHETLSHCVEKQALKNGFVGTYDQAVETFRTKCN